jgi:PleD family two-component response regulator
MDDMDEMASLHSAGVTARHTSPFDGLTGLRNENDLDDAFVVKWVVPR